MRWLFVSLLLWSPLAAAGLAVSPSVIEQPLQPGDNTLELIVSNTGHEDLQVDLSTGPLAHDVEGNAIPGQPHPTLDASSLIRFEKPRFVLKARKWRRIRAHVTGAPRPGGAYAFIYVRGTPAASAKDNELAVSWRLGVLTLLTPPGPTAPQAELSDLQISSEGPRVRIKNTGNVHVRPEGRVVLKDATGKALWTGKLLPRVVLPGQERHLSLDGAPQLPSGSYTAEVQLESPTRATLSRAVAQVEGQLIVAR